MISLGAHLAVVGVVAVVSAAPSLPIRVPIVSLSLVGEGPGGSAARVATRPRSSAPATTQGESPAATASRVPPAGAASTSQIAPPDSVPVRAARSEPLTGMVTAPAAADVLSDVAAVSAGSGAVPGTNVNEAPGASTGTQWGWQGPARTLIRKRAPDFPVVLSAMGQEIEGEARITVAPSGIVTRVEITRSSGYIEIDASVEAALRDYLFTKVEGRVDTVGTVEFRFRLEKQD